MTTIDANFGGAGIPHGAGLAGEIPLSDTTRESRLADLLDNSDLVARMNRAFERSRARHDGQLLVSEMVELEIDSEQV